MTSQGVGVFRAVPLQGPFGLSLSKPLHRVCQHFDELSANGCAVGAFEKLSLLSYHAFMNPRLRLKFFRFGNTVSSCASVAPNHLPSVLPIVSTEVTGR